jgi:hypothetical protein
MARAKSEGGARPSLRPDPRVEPESARGGRIEGARIVEEVVLGRGRDPRAEPEAPTPQAPPAPAKPEEPQATDVDVGSDAPAPAPAPAPPPPAPSPPMKDARYALVDSLIAQNAWPELVERIDVGREAGDLPAGLTLVVAVAQREASGADASGANALAIDAMAELLGVRPDSHTALFLAKRLLWQPPPVTQKESPSPARFWVPAVLVGLAIGVVVGWLASRLFAL